MSTGYILSIGYMSGYSSHMSYEQAWQTLKCSVEQIRSDPSRIVSEAQRVGAPEQGRDSSPFSLEQMAEWYRSHDPQFEAGPHRRHDGLFVFEELLPERACSVIQLTTSGSGDRTLKEQVRRAFCRLVIEEMHRLGIEVNLEVV